MRPTKCRTPPLLLAFIGAGAGLALAACAEESPERAIYALAHALEHDDLSGACERLYPSSRLPPDVRAALNVDPGADWAPEQASCQRALDRGSLADYRLDEPRVRDVSTPSFDPIEGITAIATAQVALDGGRPVVIRLVETGGRWRVVPASG